MTLHSDAMLWKATGAEFLKLLAENERFMKILMRKNMSGFNLIFFYKMY